MRSRRLITIVCVIALVICMLPAGVFADTDLSVKDARIYFRSGSKKVDATGKEWCLLEGRSSVLVLDISPSDNIASVAISSTDTTAAKVSSATLTGCKVTGIKKGTSTLNVSITGKDGSVINKTVLIKVFALNMPKNKRYKGPSRYKEAISNIEKRYNSKPQNKVIFYGNSSIRRWTKLAEDMPKLSVLNHGFGGSDVNDCLYYADRMIIPFNPKAIVFYAGSNDVGHGYSADAVYTRTRELFEYMHCRLPKAKIYYISIPKQPKRAKKWPTIKALNRKVRAYSKTDPLVTYISASAKLTTAKKSVRAKYFLKDGIHLTRKGYKVWIKVIRPILYKDLTY